MHGQLETQNARFINPPRNRRIGIIGAGPGGMALAHRFKEAGYDNITIWEKGNDVGGTWNNNRYPGLECDVASHLYSFSFDLNPSWSKAFARQPEILEYMKGVADRQDIRRHVRFSTEVLGASWDDECTCWRVKLPGGEEATVDILVSAQGMFNLLKWPNIEGCDSFAGPLVHTGNWPDGLELAGKRVAVIGSAATAVQMVPELAKTVGQLDMYQRTPSWVLPKDDPVFDEETIAAREADPDLARQERLRLYREMDDFCKWTELHDDSDFVAAALQNIEVVKDPETRAKLTPGFNWGCARPLFSNEYYPTFNRDNVTLLTDGIERITPEGIVDKTGTAREYDVIICATGYQTDKFLSAIDVRGRNGVHINDAWADGASAYMGVVTHGFPNLFMSYGPNTNNGSLIVMAEYEAAYIVRHVQWMDANDIAWIDVRPEVEQAYNDEIQSQIAKVTLWQGACHNYYFSESGRVVTQYPLNMSTYRDRSMRPDWDNYTIQYGVAI